MSLTKNKLQFALLFLVSMILAQQGDTPFASTVYKEVKSSAPIKTKNVESTIKTEKDSALMKKGVENFNSGKYRSAIQIFEKLIKSHPQSLEVCCYLAQSYFNVNRYSEAVQVYEESNNILQLSTEDCVVLVQSYLQLGAQQKALEFLSTMKNSAEKHFYLGVTYKSIQQFPLSLEHFCQAYLLYKNAQSANRVEVEKAIVEVYGVMKTDHLDTFYSILKKYEIDFK